jgi:flagellar assembly protein FliH
MSPTSASVLKASQARELGSKVAFNFEDLRHQAEAHLATVRAEADALLQRARRDADALREKLLTETRDAGRKDGLKDAAALIEKQARQIADQRLAEQLQTTLPALAKVADALRAERERWLLEWDQAAIGLSIAIAEKLVRAQLAAKPELAQGMIAEALQLAVGQPQVRVFLNPEDRQRLEPRTEQVVQSITACATPEIVEDPTLSPGDCRIETQHGEIDARLETMLHRIAEELMSG